MQVRLGKRMNKPVIYGLIGVSGIVLAWMVQTAQNPEDQIQNTAVDHSRKSAHRIQLGSLELSVPEGWIREKPVSSMRTAQFRLPRAEGDLEDAEVAVFNNIGGSVEQNIERWVGQFSQPGGGPSTGFERIKNFTINELHITLVYIEGIYSSRGASMSGPVMEKPDFSLLAAIVNTPDGPYYFKATGPVSTVQNWAGSFDALTQSFRFTG